MARNSTDTKENLLDAFDILLDEHGTSGATLDAVAAKAGVSKGGLLYHFASKAALVDGLIARLQERAEVDAHEMRDAPEGSAAHYVRTSAEVDSAFDRTLLAALRLSLGTDSRVTEALQEIRARWLRLIADDVGDDDVARAVLLMGDGLYAASLAVDSPTAALGTTDADRHAGALLRVVDRLRARPR